MINRGNFLNDEKFKQFFSCQENSNTSFSADYKNLSNLIEAAESDRKKWLFINEIRNSNSAEHNMLIKCIQRLCHRP